MNRRALLQAMLAAAPIVGQVEPVRRVYSFLWDNPLVSLYGDGSEGDLVIGDTIEVLVGGVGLMSAREAMAIDPRYRLWRIVAIRGAGGGGKSTGYEKGGTT